ncbi:MAG: CRTAC1 family protein [Planctomycetes bacterium]|nr:CRTAC1 family protein [Planctomycetota bacterium]
MPKTTGLIAFGILLAAALFLGVFRYFRFDTQTMSENGHMVARLHHIANTRQPSINSYLNDERAQRIRIQLEKQTQTSQPELRLMYARELLRSGKTLAALDELQNTQSRLISMGSRMDPELMTVLRELAAVSYLRLGEQENCILHHGIDSCLFPIKGSGLHTQTRGARGAVDVLSVLLKQDPDNLSYRWLLNLAYMTLGEHPEGVPESWLIDQSAFSSEATIPRFLDIAPQSKLDTMGLCGGCVMEDFDGDGYLDILVSSWNLNDPLQLFHNNGDGTFRDDSETSGIAGLGGALNMIHADYNNDGHPDVLVLRGAWMGKDGHHPNSLLHNNGDGTFRDVTESSGLLSFHPTQTASWGDYNNDGWLDLFIGNESSENDNHPCELYHNNGDGTFTECANELGLNVRAFVKAAVWGDYNNDRREDLFLSCYGEPNLLFRNEGPSISSHPDLDQHPETVPRWSFQEIGAQAGITEPLFSFPAWFWDYYNDGWQDLFVASYSWESEADAAADYLGLPHQAELPRVYRNNQDGTFSNVTSKTRLDRVLMAMGCNFGDLDNDGFLDCYIGTGEPDLRALVPNRMFRNNRGEFFQDVTTSGGFGHLQKGHGVAFGDIDNDGDQDIYAVMGGAYSGDRFQNVLFENPGNDNHWITLRLQGKSSNRFGIGARIRICVVQDNQRRDIHYRVDTGGSFGSSSLQQEIGLGNADHIDFIEITWPCSDQKQIVRKVEMDRVLHVTESF